MVSEIRIDFSDFMPMKAEIAVYLRDNNGSYAQ